MERSNVIARAAADLRGLADASDGGSDVASAARQLKAHEFVLQLCRQLKLIWTDARQVALTDGLRPPTVKERLHAVLAMNPLGKAAHRGQGAIRVTRSQVRTTRSGTRWKESKRKPCKCEKNI